jgi:hypothetical protein
LLMMLLEKKVRYVDRVAVSVCFSRRLWKFKKCAQVAKPLM